jgi:hypothetical protein
MVHTVRNFYDTFHVSDRAHVLSKYKPSFLRPVATFRVANEVKTTR